MIGGSGGPFWPHEAEIVDRINAEIAAILNEHFIPIKVDREERPDVDKVYMTYVQAMTGHGGWPLSAWLTPELKPFYGGTYLGTKKILSVGGAFDFQADSPEKQDALVKLAFGDFGDPAKTKFINTEAISRLKGFDVAQNPEHKAALNRVLDGLKGQPQFVTLVEKFSVADRYPDLLALAQSKPDDQIGMDATRILPGQRIMEVETANVFNPLFLNTQVDILRSRVVLAYAIFLAAASIGG